MDYCNMREGRRAEAPAAGEAARQHAGGLRIVHMRDDCSVGSGRAGAGVYATSTAGGCTK